MKHSKTFIISNEVAVRNLSLALVNFITVDGNEVIDHSTPVKIRATVTKDEDSLDGEESEGIYEGILNILEVTVGIKSPE